jgi:predicted DNA-binding transcriptional regulator AlpA
MASPEVTGRKIGVGGVDAYRIPEFCRSHGISQAFFFKLQAAGLGPRVMRLGARVLISKESAAAWRRERELASQQGGA